MTHQEIASALDGPVLNGTAYFTREDQFGQFILMVSAFDPLSREPRTEISDKHSASGSDFGHLHFVLPCW